MALGWFRFPITGGEMRPGTLGSILRQAGMRSSEFHRWAEEIL